MMKPYRNKQYTDDARDQSCVNCGVADGTVVACHLSMPGFGGTGTKCHDFMTADLCFSCHDKLDGRRQPSWQNDWELRYRLVMRTLERRLCSEDFCLPGWSLRPIE